jgi:hypothetical protein
MSPRVSNRPAVTATAVDRGFRTVPTPVVVAAVASGGQGLKAVS